MAITPQYTGSGGGLYPASSQSQFFSPLGANKINEVAGGPPAGSVYLGSIAYTGDSMTDYRDKVTWGYPVANATYTTIRDWLGKAIGVTHGRARLLGGSGVSLRTLGQMRAGFATEVLPYNAHINIVQGGSNDNDGGITAAQSLQELLGMRALLRDNQILLYVGTAGITRNNGVNKHYFRQLDYLCREAARSVPGFLYFPSQAAFFDYSSTAVNSVYGTPTTAPVASLADSTHPSGYGATLWGNALGAYLKTLLQHLPDAHSLWNDYESGNSFADSLAVNSQFFGTGGTVNAGCTGQAPDYYTLSRSGGITAAGTLAARTDGGPGKRWTLAISGATAATDLVTVSVVYSNAQGQMASFIGKQTRFQAGVKVSVTSGAVTWLRLQSRLMGGGERWRLAAGEPFSATNEYDYITSLDSMVSTPWAVIPVGTQDLNYQIEIGTTVGAQVSVELTSTTHPVVI